MSHGQICPVCNKTGVYEGKTCHGCGGKGWVAVPDNLIIFPLEPGPRRGFNPWPPAHRPPKYVRDRWGLRGFVA